MLALLFTHLATAGLVAAQSDASPYNTRVHSSVIFTRTGEHTPHLGSNAIPSLTSYGAQQLYAIGGAFRDRYMGYSSESNPLAINRLVGISNYSIDNSELRVMTLDEEYLIASAQAFMQGLYPPFTLSQGQAAQLDPTSVLANSSYVEYPLGGYQYPQIETFGISDLHAIYLDGANNCITQMISAQSYYNTPEFAQTKNATAALYREVGIATMSDVLDQTEWDYSNAYLIYEYLDYQVRHNTSVSTILTANNTAYSGDFAHIHQLASQQQRAFYGNKTVDNGIRTMAGQTLAAKVMSLLWANIASYGTNGKINVMFGDHEPFMSFFSIANLARMNSNFNNIPDYGSSMVFELFSQGSATNTTFPDISDLWVKFYFRNGSDVSEDLQAFSMFNRGPSETDMRLSDFQYEMEKIMTSSVSDWCTACSSPSLFCLAINPTQSTGESSRSHSSLSPQVAGAIGAVVTLAFIGLVLAAAMLIGGIRFHRVNRNKKSELGGFKGSAKLASDADLAIPKAAPMPIGARVDASKSRERVGSWELKQKEMGKPVVNEEEDDDISVNPFGDPVKPRESV